MHNHCLFYIVYDYYRLNVDYATSEFQSSVHLKHAVKYSDICGGVQVPNCPLPRIPNQNTHLDLRDGESYSGDESRLSLLLSLLQSQAGRPTAQSDKTNRNQHMLTNTSCYHNIDNPQ